MGLRMLATRGGETTPIRFPGSLSQYSMRSGNPLPTAVVPICPELFSVPWHSHTTSLPIQKNVPVPHGVSQINLEKLETGTKPKLGIPSMPWILPLGGTGKNERALGSY